MAHEKLVAGTSSPTRYTKIIRNPGAGTKYNRTYQETDYVSRYTKTVAGGKDYAPPAPPSDPLAVAEGKGANWVGSNVYEIGQTVEARTAEYVGGVEPVIYRYRFQTKAKGSDSWDNGSWINTTNEKNPVFRSIVDTGQIKFQSQARDASDPTVQLNSVTGVKTIVDPSALVVSTPVVTGEPMVGQTLTCSEPTVSGGIGPYQFDYFWVDESNVIVWDNTYMGNTTMVVAYDIDKNMKCLVQVTDKGYAKGESITVTSNSVGPVRAPLIGDLTTSVDGSAYTEGEVVDTMNGIEHICLIERTGDPGVTYEWTVRQGQARLSPASGSCIVNIQSAPPMGVQVQCSLRNDNASDNPKSFRFGFYVGEGGLSWDLVPNECVEPAVITATNGAKAGSVLSVVNPGAPSIASTYYKHFWEACEKGKDYEIDNNWRSRNSSETYLVDDYDANHNHVFRIKVEFESEAASSNGYSKFAYCYSNIIE